MNKLNVIIASGNTVEKIDDVRVLTNISSGKLGAKIADKFIDHGHNVTYVSPRNAISPSGICSKEIITNVDSLMRVMERLVKKDDTHVVIQVIAVSDFTFNYEGAIKCGSDSAEDFIEHMRKTIVKTPKVISNFRKWNKKAILVGFKFTSGKSKHELSVIAKKLMNENNLNMVFANDKKKMEEEGEHVGTLIMQDWEEYIRGKEEISTCIYENVIRLCGK